MNKVMAIAVITFMLAGISMAQERPQALIFTGAPNGADTTILVDPGSWIDVPVYFQAAEDTVFGADLAYSLGINNCYFDQIDTSQGASQYFYPFTIWDYAYFFSFRQDWRTDDEGCTWDNYSFVGSSNDPNPPFNNYWLTLIPGAPPVHGLTFRIHASDYVAPANHFSCNAIGPGDSGI